MSKECNNCGRIDPNASIPFAAFEANEQRHERKERNFFVVILVLIGLLVLSNLAWLLYESQFEVVEETETITQESESGDINYIGNDGDILNGTTNN